MWEKISQLIGVTVTFDDDTCGHLCCRTPLHLHPLLKDRSSISQTNVYTKIEIENFSSNQYLPIRKKIVIFFNTSLPSASNCFLQENIWKLFCYLIYLSSYKQLYTHNLFVVWIWHIICISTNQPMENSLYSNSLAIYSAEKFNWCILQFIFFHFT